MTSINPIEGREWVALGVLGLTIGSTAVACLLVFARKRRRDRSEAASDAARRAMLAALQAGDEAALDASTDGVSDFATRVHLDLLAVISANRDAAWWTDETTDTLRRVLATRGFVNGLARQLTSRSAPRRGAAVLLASHPACALPTSDIAACLRDINSTVRLAAASALERIKTAEAAHALIDALEHRVIPSPRIVERLGHSWAVETCIDRLRAPGAAAGAARPHLARALGLAGDARAVPVLLELVASGRPDERVQAMRALGQCAAQAPRADRISIAHAARGRLSASDPVLVLMATRALAATGDETDVDAFVELVGNADWHVRREAAQALVRMGGRARSALLAVACGPDADAAARAREELQIVEPLDRDDGLD